MINKIYSSTFFNWLENASHYIYRLKKETGHGN